MLLTILICLLVACLILNILNWLSDYMIELEYRKKLEKYYKDTFVP